MYYLSDEARCNQEIETFLRAHHTLLEEKVEYWMDKYDHDVEQKQTELDTLKSTKASDLARLQELTQKYHEYSKVVEEDRLEKERLRREAERELEENNACYTNAVLVERCYGAQTIRTIPCKKEGEEREKEWERKEGWEEEIICNCITLYCNIKVLI